MEDFSHSTIFFDPHKLPGAEADADTVASMRQEPVAFEQLFSALAKGGLIEHGEEW